jgi:hypothetical protein
MKPTFSTDASPKWWDNSHHFANYDAQIKEQQRVARLHELRLACLNNRQTLKQCGL